MKDTAARTTTPSPTASALASVACAVAALLGLGSSPALAQGKPGPSHAVPAPQPRAASPAQIKAAGSYSLGVSMGARLRQASVDAGAISVPKLLQGLRDSLGGKATFTAADQQSIRALVMQARARLGQANYAAAHAFLARNGKKKGVVTTASGLEYEVLKAGQGSPPQPGDEVTVNYRGTLLNGTEFDSSYKRGRPFTFPMGAGMIQGWQEALKMMKPGARWRIFIPPKLAYDLNSPPPIPPGSMLIFDVNLLQVKPPAAPAPQIQPPPAGKSQP
jgi:FKBP-type peptidyl-prolyl cis-trans isomerase FklB